MDHTSGHPVAYLFPLLRNSEILQCMAELNVELTKTELTEPQRHKDSVRKVFQTLLKDCCGLGEEDFHPANCVPSNAEPIKYEELHEDSFSELRFFKEVRYFMQTCGIHDFGLRDLQHPTAKRFRAQLSGAINMAKFREDKISLYCELMEPRGEIAAHLEAAELEQAALVQELEATDQENEEKMREYEEVKHDCQLLGREISEHNAFNKSCREENSRLKEKYNDLLSKVGIAKMDLTDKKAEEELLLPKVVSSPGKKREELDHQRALLERERRECEEAKENLALVKTKIANVTQAQQDVGVAIGVAEEVKEIAEEHNQVMGQVRQETKQVDATKNKTEKLVVQNEECERVLRRIEENISHSRQQSKMKMDAAQASLERAKGELLEVQRAQLEGAARVEAGEDEVRALKAQMEESKKLADKEIAEMVEEFRKLERKVIEQDNESMAIISGH